MRAILNPNPDFVSTNPPFTTPDVLLGESLVECCMWPLFSSSVYFRSPSFTTDGPHEQNDRPFKNEQSYFFMSQFCSVKLKMKQKIPVQSLIYESSFQGGCTIRLYTG